MNNPYDTLGVATDATQDEIRAAYRKAAREAHPDREGGSTERMQDVNQAYDLLSDPERRARYDAGADESGPDAFARRVMRDLFNQAIDENATDVLAYANTHLDRAIQNANLAIGARRTKITALEKLRNRIKPKTSRDLYHSLLEQRIAAASDELRQYESVLTNAARVRVLLSDEYERGTVSEPPAQKQGDALYESMRRRFLDESMFGAMGSRWRDI